MDERNNTLELRIAMDFNTIKTDFASNTQLETSDDYVTFNFLQFFPGGPADQPNTKIISRVAVSWPHFAKMTKMMNEMLERNKGLAYTDFVNTVMNNGDNTNGMGK